MKLAIRLQRHGKVNHPLWWIVVAPNKKNPHGPFIQHLGYWYPKQKIVVKRQIILNIMRIKYWISCGAVPTKRVQYFLHYFGVMPKPWYYEKTQEELAKQNTKKEGQQLTEKEKRKLENKIKRKALRQSTEVKSTNGLIRNKKIYTTPQARRYAEMLEVQQKQNDYLRELMIQNDFQHYLQMKKLAGEKITDLGHLSDKVKKLQAQLRQLEEKSNRMHPVKKAMLINRINQLFPQLVEATEQQEQKMFDQNQPNPEQAVLGRAALHEIVMKRYEIFNKEMDEYYKRKVLLTQVLEPLTMESYAEYLVAKKGMTKPQAQAQSVQFFESIQNLRIVPTLEDAIQITEGKINKTQPINDPDSSDSEAAEYQQNLDTTNADWSTSTFFQSPPKFYKAIIDRAIIPPSRNPVNPYPDLRKYVPSDYYELPHNKIKVVQVPALQPEEQLERYRAKRSHKKTQ